VNLVSSLGQFDSQLGRDNSASTVSRVTGDSYLHRFSIFGLHGLVYGPVRSCNKY
jgi:hypothetical protein